MQHRNIGTAGGGSIVSPPPYPTIVNADGSVKKVCIVTAYYNGFGLGLFKVHFDRNGDVLSCAGDMVFLFDSLTFTAMLRHDSLATTPYTLSAKDASQVRAYLESIGPNFIAMEEDAETFKALQPYHDKFQELRQTVIATVPEIVCNECVPGEGRSAFCTANETQQQVGGVGNLVAKAMLYTARRRSRVFADFAIVHAAYFRMDIPKGNFTAYDSYVLLPFSHTVVTMNMTGEQVVKLLEDVIDDVVERGAKSTYPYGKLVLEGILLDCCTCFLSFSYLSPQSASGIRFHVDTAAARGRRISKLQVQAHLFLGTNSSSSWYHISFNKTYAVVTSSFLASGRAVFDEFGEIHRYADTDIQLPEAFAYYAQDVKHLVDVHKSEYSTQSYRCNKDY